MAAGALAIRPITRTAAASVGGNSAARAKKTVINIEKVLRKKIKDSRSTFSKQKRTATRVKEQGTRTASEAGLEKTSKFRMNLLDKVPNSGVDAFARLMNFLGLYLTGWVVDKLPKIINALKDLQKRIQFLSGQFGKYVETSVGLITATGKLIAAKGKQILTLDFGDKSGDVKKAQDELDRAYDELEDDYDKAVRILTAPLGSYPTEEVGRGQSAAPTGADASGGAVSINDKNARALLNAIAEAEGTSRYANQGYNTQYTGKQFEGTEHPREILGDSSLRSDAAGRYQFLSTTWDSVMGGEMTPDRQDEAALKLVAGRGVNIKDGLSESEIYRIGGEWASVEGGPQMKRGGGYGGQAKYSAKQFMRLYEKYGGTVQPGAGDGRQSRSGGQTPAYSQAVAVGRGLEKDGYRAWQHPDFSVDRGYTGSGRERVMRRSYNSYHNFGEALDFPLSHNSEAKLDKLSNYFKNNRSNLGVAELLWKNDPNHYDHLHVSFKGGGKSVASMPGSSLAPLPGDDPEAQQSAFMQQLNAALAAATKEGSQPDAAPQRKTSSPAPSMPDNTLNSMLFTALSYT